MEKESTPQRHDNIELLDNSTHLTRSMRNLDDCPDEEVEEQSGSESKKRKWVADTPPVLGSSITWLPQNQHTSVFSNKYVKSLSHENDTQYNKILVNIDTSEQLDEKRDLSLKVVCLMKRDQTLLGTNREHPAGQQCFVPLHHFAEVTREYKPLMGGQETTLCVELRTPMRILESVMKHQEDEIVSGRSLMNLIVQGKYKLYLAMETKEGEVVEDKEELKDYWRRNDKEGTNKRRKTNEREKQGEEEEKQQKDGRVTRSEDSEYRSRAQCGGVAEMMEKEGTEFFPELSPFLPSYYDLLIDVSPTRDSEVREGEEGIQSPGRKQGGVPYTAEVVGNLDLTL